MNSQSGISIAAIAVAIVSIGISTGLISSMNQDISDLKSTIDDLNQISSRGGIEQQAITKDGIIWKTRPVESDNPNVQSSSQSPAISDSIANVPRPLTVSEEIEELKSKDKKLRQKISGLEDRLGNIRLVSDWSMTAIPVDGKDRFLYEINCPNENDVVVSIHTVADSKTYDHVVSYEVPIHPSTIDKPTLEMNNEKRSGAIVSFVWACAHIEAPYDYDPHE